MWQVGAMYIPLTLIAFTPLYQLPPLVSIHNLPSSFNLKINIMSTDYKFEGWCGLDASSAKGNMKWLVVFNS